LNYIYDSNNNQKETKVVTKEYSCAYGLKKLH